MWSKVNLVIGCLLTANYIASQPVNDGPENFRLSRELDFEKCCPCPGPSGSSEGRNHALPSLAPPEGVDDCPCRMRSADSDGDSSIFFPTYTKSFAKQNEEKEEAKNLLEPEVNLASSVLETLREVTEEEHQDALARDATRAKAAKENTFNDAMPEESGRNIVTIIVDPEQFEHNDAVTDSTHVKDSRCIHPSGRSLGRMSIPSSSSTNVIDDILKLPNKSPQDLLHRNLLDSDSYGGATNIRENFVNPMNESPQNSGDIDCDDLGFASSNMQERFAEKQNPKLKLKSINPINGISEVKKMPPNNLFESKDVEFIPEKKYKDALNPNFEVKQLFNRDRQKPLDLFEILNGLKLNFKKPSLTNDEDSSIKTEILDTIPNKTNKMSKPTTYINSEVENIQINQTSGIPSDSQSNDVKTTDILDTLFKPPENQVIFIFDGETNLDKSQERNNQKNERLKEESMAELENIEESQKQAESLRENYEYLENNFDENLRTVNDDYYTHGQNEESLRDEQNIADGFSSINRKTELDQSKESILSNTNIPLDCNQDTKTNNSENEFLLTEILNSETIPRKPSEIVESLKENLKKRFEAIKQKSVLPKQDILKSKDSETSREREDSNSNDKDSTLDNTETENRKGNAMSISDLQILSDSLLKLNNKLEEQALTTERFQQSHLFNGKTDADIFESTTAKNTFDIDDIKDDLSSTEQKSNIEEYKNSCSSDPNFKQNEADHVENEPLVQSNPNEMEVGASEPISRTILGNPLSLFKSDHSLRNVVSEPMSLNDSPDENDNNMIGSLPKLNDITKQLSGIFKTVDENSNENSLAEAVCPSNDSEDEESLMSAEPSTLNQQSRLAPLQDINLELFQLKPSRREPDILKSFRTKLKLPKEFEFKPMKLHSVMDNKNSLLGGTLSVNPKYKSKSRLASKPLDDFSNVLKRPFGDLPRLDDITTSFRENAQNLLNRGRNLIPNDFAPTTSLDTLTENLKSRTENAVQNIKQSVDSTFKDVNGNTLFGDRIPKPNELFEKIAGVREDFNEKLLGLHHDLNDRLTTLHENIFDQTRFMSSRIPIIKPGEKGRTNIQPIKKNKSKPIKLLTAESRTEEVQKYIPLRNRIENNDFRNSDRIFEPESNVPALKSVEMPRLEQTIRKRPLGLPQRDYNLKSNNLESMSNIEKPSFHPRKYLLRKEINPFKDSTFKITFATTTPTPTTPMPRSKLFITPKERNDFLTNRGTSCITKLKSHDNNVLPSDMQPARLPVPNKQTIYAEDESNTLQSFRAKHLPMRIIQPLTRSENIDETDESNEQHEGLLRKPWSGVTWPKKSDESLLNQIRDEIKARKAMESIDHNNKQPSNDLIKSTSDNTEVQVFDKHLKENVTYKCKMICTRE